LELIPSFNPVSENSRGPTAAPLPRLLAALLTLVYLAVLVRTAWLSDDAAITLRTVMNVTHGFGLTFNVAERVQTFTHPLWLLVLTAGYMLTRHLYLVTFAASVGVSLSVFWLVVTRAASASQAALAVVALLFSRAFVDFSTSGLENPLVSLLLIGLVVLFLNERMERSRWLARLWTLGSLLYLARPDAVLLAVPMLGVASWQVRRPSTIARAFFMGTAPAWAWTLFATLYYGFPLPNTAYAKLAMGIPAHALWTQGALYFVDSIDRDPLTLTTVAFALVAAAAARRTAPRVLAAGIVLYLLYVMSIGGDFMAGRFFSVPLVASVLLLTRLMAAPRALWIPAAGVLALVGCTATHVPLWSNSRFSDSNAKPNGVIDERAVYFHDKSLVLARRVTFRDPEWPRAGTRPQRMNVLPACGLMGSSGLDFGPYAYLLDECALADPLLARLPAVFNPEWRTGHYRRMIPAGYRDSVEKSDNELQDPSLHEYYDHLRLIIRSDRLWSTARLKAIVAMNLGRYDHLIDRTYYRHGGSVVGIETPGNAEGTFELKAPLAITCPDKRGRRYLEVSLEADDRYFVMLLRKGRIESTLDLGPIPEYRRRPGLTTYVVDVPPNARAHGFDTIVVAPASGDGHHALGGLLLEGASGMDARIYRDVAVRDGMAR